MRVGIGAALALGGCAAPPWDSGPGGGEGRRGTAGAASGAVVEIARPLRIPAGSAHTAFQGGRQVSGPNRLETYCELEIETVAERPQEARAGRYRVTAARRTLLKDPTTRIPAPIAGFGCSDALYQESLWRLSGTAGGNVHSLRCLRPGFHCRIPPPMTLAEVPMVTGPAIAVVRP